MGNKKIGISIILIALVIIVVLFYMRAEFIKFQLKGASCEVMGNGFECPHEEINKLNIPIYIAIAVIFFGVGVGIYLAFFDKGPERFAHELKEKEKFDIMLRVLDKDERAAVKVIKDEEGISQSTLKYRLNMSKTKLSLLLKDLEKRGIVKKVSEGKSNKIYLQKII